MKNTIAILGLAALATANVQTASAGDREWATVGKVLTGVAAAHVISHALQPAPVYTVAPAPVVYVPAPAPVVVAPQPVYYAPPPPVVVYHPPRVCVPAPVVVAPRFYPPPVVSVKVGFGHHRHHHHHRRHCW